MPTVTICRGTSVCEARINQRSWYVTDSGVLVTSTDLSQVGTPTHLTITTQPSSTATTGVAFSQQPVIQLRDAGENPALQSGVTVTASIASDPGGSPALSNETAVTNGSGVATFSGLTITGNDGAYTLDFDADGLTGVTSNTITVSSTSPSVIFHSDWSTATGESQAALLDTDKATPWTDEVGASAGNSAIETAASLGVTNWPVANLYRVPSDGSSFIAQAIQFDLGAPSNGDDRYFRVYLQVRWADSHGGSGKSNWEHGMETADALTGGGDGFVFVRIPQNDGTWWPVWGEISDPSGRRYIGWNLSFSKTETYRCEWHLAYGSTTYAVEIRIYDEDGVLVATEDDYWRYLPTENPAMLLGDEAFTYTASDHRYFRVGTNGPTSNFPLANITDNQPLFYYGAVAISESDWCGPYAGGV